FNSVYQKEAFFASAQASVRLLGLEALDLLALAEDEVSSKAVRLQALQGLAQLLGPCKERDAVGRAQRFRKGCGLCGVRLLAEEGDALLALGRGEPRLRQDAEDPLKPDGEAHGGHGLVR